MSWGQEVLVDCRGCNLAIRDRGLIEAFIQDLCLAIGMERVGDPVFVHIDDLGDKSGWTCFQMIRFSSVICHFCDNGDAFFDVFSCKNVDAMVVKAVIDKWCSPQEIRVRQVVRGDW